MESQDIDSLISLLDKYGLEVVITKLSNVCYLRGREALKAKEMYDFAFWRTSTDIMKDASVELQLLQKMFSSSEQGSSPENK